VSAIEGGAAPEQDCGTALRGYTEAGDCALAGQPGPENSAVVCADGVDNDGDGFIDCGGSGTEPDFDCTGSPSSGGMSFCGEVRCDDGIDDDGNGQRDCADIACASAAYCGDENTADRCLDGVDNDGDGFVDCEDHDCSRNPALHVCGTEQCFNFEDDDGDDDIDCADSDCAGMVPCGPEDTNATCSDGFDNDGDGFIDCDGSYTEPDFDCSRNPSVTICTAL
jgi:hypothetical protein